VVTPAAVTDTAIGAVFLFASFVPRPNVLYPQIMVFWGRSIWLLSAFYKCAIVWYWNARSGELSDSIPQI
jgi:hypothetical protein